MCHSHQEHFHIFSPSSYNIFRLNDEKLQKIFEQSLPASNVINVCDCACVCVYGVGWKNQS